MSPDDVNPMEDLFPSDPAPTANQVVDGDVAGNQVEEEKPKVVLPVGKKLDLTKLPEVDSDEDRGTADALWARVEEYRKDRNRGDIPISDPFWEALDEFQLYMNTQESARSRK